MNLENKILNRTITPEDSLIFALKRMDTLGVKSLLVLNMNNEFAGVISIGDIQRSIINNISLDQHIRHILRVNPRYATNQTTMDYIKDEMITYRMEFMPVVDSNKKIIKLIFWEDLFPQKQVMLGRTFNLPVVIMAGGMGTRLRPLTNVLPKPLIPFGEKTIIEQIFDRFAAHGCDKFFISLNYKANLIEYYINEQKLPYNIKYVIEDEPMGTAGSLQLIKEEIHGTFFVSNCDILIEQDYSEILDYHESGKNDITIVAALRHYPIPYGVIETTKNGILTSLQEKPELTFKINSGMYILESHILNEIPLGSFFHITQLIEKIHVKGGKVGVFPVSEKSWKDIGNWSDYMTTEQYK